MTHKTHIIIITTVCLLWTMPTFAQQKQGKVSCPAARDTEQMSIVDTCHLRIWYALNAEDINLPSTYIDLQCLEVGEHLHKYYSRFVAASDSLCTAWRHAHPNAQGVPRWLGEGGKHPLFWSEYQYSEIFKTRTELKAYCRMPAHFNHFDAWYAEPYPSQQWDIQADTLTICGYSCQKATCTFRGRNFTAWFTADIPVAEGPWKFGGLPGLILKIYDEHKLYTFECIQIQQGNFPIRKYGYEKYRQIPRKKLLQLQKRLNENYVSFGGAIDRNTGKKLSRFTPYEPLELE